MVEKAVFAIAQGVLFLGGVFGSVVGLILFFSDRTVAEYGTAWAVAGLWLVGSALVGFLRSKL